MTFRTLIGTLAAGLLALLPASTCAQSEPPFPAAEFRIGYLRADPESALTPPVLRALRDSLLARPAFREALRLSGLDGIALLAADSHQNLVERMSQTEFDLVFCSAIHYVTQQGSYDPLFQMRRPGDSFDPRGQQVFHRGIFLAGAGSPLFRREPDPPLLTSLAETGDFACVSSFSAAGYTYPLLKIADLTSNTIPRRIVFCDSSEEVIKHVISGVAPWGACEEAALAPVLEQSGIAGERDRIVRVVLETDPIPSDPVLLRRRYLPAQSSLGREVRDGLQQFFDTHRPQLPKLVPAASRNYDDLRANLERLSELSRESVPLPAPDAAR